MVLLFFSVVQTDKEMFVVEKTLQIFTILRPETFYIALKLSFNMTAKSKWYVV